VREIALQPSSPSEWKIRRKCLPRLSFVRRSGVIASLLCGPVGVTLFLVSQQYQANHGLPIAKATSTFADKGD